jgi:hypothetical protein
METESSLPQSQMLTTCPYPELSCKWLTAALINNFGSEKK